MHVSELCIFVYRDTTRFIEDILLFFANVLQLELEIGIDWKLHTAEYDYPDFWHTATSNWFEHFLPIVVLPTRVLYYQPLSAVYTSSSLILSEFPQFKSILNLSHFFMTFRISITWFGFHLAILPIISFSHFSDVGFCYVIRELDTQLPPFHLFFFSCTRFPV